MTEVAEITCTADNNPMQWLVSFANKTLVLNLPCGSETEEELVDIILTQTSLETGWPAARLILQSLSPPWATVRVQSSVRGGKGGFGTLLRSSARQSGAKLTTDFGACRDLQGRRLRHVNDEIKLRKWREAQERKQQNKDGTTIEEETEAMFDTPSGLYNWHLMVPSWADISKKSSRKIQRQFRRMQQEEDKIQQEKQERRAQYERSVTIYVQKTADAAKEVQNNVMSAVKQGLEAQREKKRKREEELAVKPADIFNSTDRPNSLCTLSGDVVVEEDAKKPSVFQIQSQADFSTLALFLDKPLSKTEASSTILYYEVRLVTGGLAQIGWADMTSKDFKPNTEEGEGVGDDKGSFGYDGSRSLKFHGGKEEVYKNSLWKAGDVVGCQYNLQSGEISYAVNGKELGVAFTHPEPGTILFPALSCNGGEILELHVDSNDMAFLPKTDETTRYVSVKDLIAGNIIDTTTASDETTSKPSEEDDSKPAAEGKTKNEEKEETKTEPAAVEPEPEKKEPVKKEPVKVEALDLDKFQSAADLEELGLDRLKGALMAIGVKCG
jgi:SPRY domain/Silencing defective 2 N-terminal ubiquitin domain/Replication stress response SDE2 C-terminal